MSRYGFFNAVMNNGKADRLYTADDINDFFRGVLSDGVFRGVFENLLVALGGAMSVMVYRGKAMVNQHWFINEHQTNISINSAHATLNRYSSVVVRYDKSKRTVELGVVDGANAQTPVIPTLTQTEDVYEIALAHVYVGAGVTSITADNITDARSYVMGLVDPVPLNYRRYDYKVADYESGQSYFDIPLSYGLNLDTNLMVYCNGLLCMPTEYYLMVNEIEGNYMVVFNTKRAQGSELSFIMIN